MSKAVLRWAGGKRWLLKFFDEYTPKRIHNYYEPFAGGISVLLHLIETDKYQIFLLLMIQMKNL